MEISQVAKAAQCCLDISRNDDVGARLDLNVPMSILISKFDVLVPFNGYAPHASGTAHEQASNREQMLVEVPTMHRFDAAQLGRELTFNVSLHSLSSVTERLQICGPVVWRCQFECD